MTGIGSSVSLKEYLHIRAGFRALNLKRQLSLFASVDHKQAKKLTRRSVILENSNFPITILRLPRVQNLRTYETAKLGNLCWDRCITCWSGCAQGKGTRIR